MPASSVLNSSLPRSRLDDLARDAIAVGERDDVGAALRIGGCAQTRPAGRTIASAARVATHGDWLSVAVYFAPFRRVRVAAERVRDVRDRPLRAHAVAGVVERRRHDGDAELARRHRDDAAADAALGRQARRDTATCRSRRRGRRWPSRRGRPAPWPRPSPVCR